jgi:hypothetical protein
LKLTVKVAILSVLLAAMPDALEVVKSSEKAVQISASIYIVMALVLLSSIGVDVYQIRFKKVHLEDHTLEDELLIKTRQALMDKVRVKIDSKLKNSLYQAARIDLGLEECPEMLKLKLQITGQEREVLPRGTRLFDRLAALGSGGTLLVLGNPGAGKTTLLMELAKNWLDCTDAREFDQAIPVVLNLSSWGNYRLSKQQCPLFSDWVVEELHRHYQLRSQIGKDWLMKSRFVLLLDGLDEVAETLRDGCVEAVNHFRQEFGTVEIVVCSRIADFQKLTKNLEHFQAAVFIQPLDKPQIEAYLQQVGELLQGVKRVLDQDSTLLELLKTPFFLWILSLAYPRRSADELINLSKESRSQRLFTRYIEKIFLNKPMPTYDQERMIHWLSILALKMGCNTEFIIGQMQPKSWINSNKLKLLYWSISGLFFWFFWSFLMLFSTISINLQSLEELLTRLIMWMIFGIVLGWTGFLDSIKLFDKFDFSRFCIMLYRNFSAMSIAFLIIYFLTKPEIEWQIATENTLKLYNKYNEFLGIVIKLFLSIYTFVIIVSLGEAKVSAQSHVRPNQAVYNSLQNLSIFIFVNTIATLLFSLITADVFRGMLNDIVFMHYFRNNLTYSLSWTLFMYGGLDCAKYFAMRLVLYWIGYIPWNFVEFFQKAEDRLFVQCSGSSYSFIHGYLQEYFASIASQDQ